MIRYEFQLPSLTTLKPSDNASHRQVSTKLTAAAAYKLDNIQEILKHGRSTSSPFVGKVIFLVSIQQHTVNSDTTGALKVFYEVIANMKNMAGFNGFVGRQKGLSLVHGGHEHASVGLLQFQVFAEALKL